MKGNLQCRRRYLQNIYLTKGLYQGFISTLQMNYRKTDETVEKWAKYLNMHSLKRTFKLQKKKKKKKPHHNRECSISLVIREMQNKTALRSHYTLPKMIKMKGQNFLKPCKGDCGAYSSLTAYWWEHQLTQPLCKNKLVA